MSHCTDCGGIADVVDTDGAIRCAMCAGTVRQNNRLDRFTEGVGGADA